MANTLTSSQADGNTSKRGRLLLILGVVLVAALGAGGFFLGNILSNRQPAAPAAPVVPPPIFVPLEAFTVNLKSDDGDRFLHTGLSLKVADAQNQARITEYLPEVRSRILLLLSAKQPPDLATVEGKRKLAQEIQNAISQPFAPNLPKQQILDVLFTSFVVQ
ncbi:flagellar basal body-associated protein FliL [Cupriavidus basilensis]|uniref:flagellar basal body-associated protein FliL n=1 Tax=Cupriavidus TaxID=106589 RepID=UPI00044DA4C8|nr:MULTISPECIES: flagellar basal body-associated protein FliL [Cupriavidus]KDP85013.1 flagellar basal body protein FliL [Cupriavidus sp. SK-3]MDF3883045.1 flagellar basal body-associated protein FliL [Cupriavidus basilensis]